jgi:hypothetical protein
MVATSNGIDEMLEEIDHQIVAFPRPLVFLDAQSERIDIEPDIGID